jgi:hypothetical protein
VVWWVVCGQVEEARAWAQTNTEALKQGRAKLFEAEHPFLTARQVTEDKRLVILFTDSHW